MHLGEKNKSIMQVMERLLNRHYLGISTAIAQRTNYSLYAQMHNIALLAMDTRTAKPGTYRG